MHSHPLSSQLPLGLRLRESARFDSYFPGENRELIPVLQACARGEGEPLVLLAGAAGVGKSHLLQASCQLAAGCGRSVAYLSLAGSTEFSTALLDGLEHQQLVCLDDVDAIAGDEGWERAVFNLFNRLRETGVTLLVSAAARADRCGFRLADLASRLGWGLTFVLLPLRDDQVLAALLRRASARGLELPEETARYLLRRLPRDLSSVFDLLDRLDEASLIEQRRLTVPFVKSVLELS